MEARTEQASESKVGTRIRGSGWLALLSGTFYVAAAIVLAGVGVILLTRRNATL